MAKLIYTVLVDYRGIAAVHSFGGKNVIEERKFARSMGGTIYYVGTDFARAQRVAASVRQARQQGAAK